VKKAVGLRREHRKKLNWPSVEERTGGRKDKAENPLHWDLIEVWAKKK